MTSALQEIRRLLVLALPLILAQLAQTSMGFVDTLMVGRLGNDQLAGIALGNTLFFFTLILCTGVLLAVGPMVSQAFGAGNREAIGRAVRQGMWLAAGLAALAAVVFWNAESLFLLMRQEPRTAALAASYVQAIAWGFLPSLWFACLRALLEGVSDTRPVMFIALFGVVLNIAANNVLMYGRLGFPALGLVGTGYASALVYAAMFVLGVLYIRRRHRDLGVFRTLRSPDPKTLREIVTVGVPIGLTLGFETGLFTVTAILMGLLGSTQLAAHQIAMQTAALTFMVPLGMSIATSVRVGQAVGRGDPEAVRRSGYVGIAMSASVMVLTALAFWLLPERIVALYVNTGDPANRELVRLAVDFLGMAALFQVFDGLQVGASGALRGLKDTRVPMLLSLVSYWGVGLSGAIVLTFVLDMGGRGLWLGLTFGLATAGVLLALRFVRSVRRHLLTGTAVPETVAR